MPLPAAFPSGLDALANPTATTNRDDPGFELDEVVSRIHDILEALEAKLGIGASLPTSAGVLRRTAPGATAWGTLQGADVGANQIPPGALVGSGGADANTVFATVGGTGVALQKVATAMVATNAITQSQRAQGATSSPTTSSAYPGGAIPDMSITMTTTGGPVLVFFTGSFRMGTVGNLAGVSIFVDTVDEGVPATKQWTCASSNEVKTIAISHLVAAPSAGSHTFVVNWWVTGSVEAYTNNRCLVVVELKR